jgi:hypothetical protein
MSGFFTRERFGRPQFWAGCLLLVFLAQCCWLVEHSLTGVNAGEIFREAEGVKQLRGLKIAGTPFPPGASDESATWFFTEDGFDPYHSPLWYITAGSPLLLWSGRLHLDSVRYWGWLVHAPYLIFGVLLGASLWYVARRLYGNAGGYIALGLYCFSPGIIRATALWFAQPEIGAAWGAFGAIFTAIAVAHTLYAPREVVLWNWRRILLLAVSLALAVGSQFSLIVVLPLALGFMFYVAPTRRRAALVIWTAASALGFLLLFASYAFHWAPFAAGMRHAAFIEISWRALAMPGAYRQTISQAGQGGPALLIAVPAALAVFALWPRTRYFGNAAPLLVAALFLLLATGSPHYPGLGFHLMALPFLFVFVAGISADLLESRYRAVAMSGILGLLGANGLWNLVELTRAAR